VVEGLFAPLLLSFLFTGGFANSLEVRWGGGKRGGEGGGGGGGWVRG